MDEKIIAALKSNNHDVVLAFLYKEALPIVKHYIKSNSGNDDEAKDIFQDAVIILYKKMKTEELPENTNITSFVCFISRNLWINRARKLNKSTAIPEDGFLQSDENLLDNIIITERKNALIGLLDQIGDECKKLLKHSVYDNQSMKEICKLMGYSSENVAKTYNYRCKQKLIQLVMKNKDMVNLLRA